MPAKPVFRLCAIFVVSKPVLAGDSGIRLQNISKSTEKDRDSCLLKVLITVR